MNYQLEVRNYSREEFAEIIGTDAKDKNFKRKAEKFLQNCGYTYNANMRKGVEILSIPATTDGQLAELLYRFYDLDVQLDTTAFGIFLYSMLNDINGFAEMPWGKRSEFMKQQYGIEVAERTLKNWGSKLIKKGLIVKSNSDKAHWRTSYNLDGEKVRELVEDGDAEQKEYWNDFWELMKTGEEDIYKQLWSKYGCCYYSCRKFECAAWDDNEREILKEIYKLVEKIMERIGKDIEIKVIKSVTYVEVPTNKEIVVGGVNINDEEFIF